MNVKQIKKLNDNDVIVIDDILLSGDSKLVSVCYVYIHYRPNQQNSSAAIALRITSNGEIKNISCRCPAVSDWESVAKCYARALEYAEMVRTLIEIDLA
jgi:hypothetical protein